MSLELPKGRKDDQQKTDRWDLLPWEALREVTEVLHFGAVIKGYTEENWRLVSGWRWRYFRAAIGHLAKWRAGERLDAESGKSHLAHAACCVLFLMALDRPGQQMVSDAPPETISREKEKR